MRHSRSQLFTLSEIIFPENNQGSYQSAENALRFYGCSSDTWLMHKTASTINWIEHIVPHFGPLNVWNGLPLIKKSSVPAVLQYILFYVVQKDLNLPWAMSHTSHIPHLLAKLLLPDGQERFSGSRFTIYLVYVVAWKEPLKRKHVMLR